MTAPQRSHQLARDARDNGRPTRNDQLFRSQFKKTELCTFWEQAWCSKGQNCPFAHGKDELRTAPNLTKTSFCRKWLKFGCTHTSADCRFAHGMQELRMTETFARGIASPWQRYDQAQPVQQAAFQVPQMPVQQPGNCAAMSLPQSSMLVPVLGGFHQPMMQAAAPFGMPPPQMPSATFMRLIQVPVTFPVGQPSQQAEPLQQPQPQMGQAFAPPAAMIVNVAPFAMAALKAAFPTNRTGSGGSTTPAASLPSSDTAVCSSPPPASLWGSAAMAEMLQQASQQQQYED
mmetsp:Transcript_11173/g.35079  ORF Transcript_11173/g.35079 Transcript_11173/m.35079 type:complete len:288 (+) Transcript_11173:168-1031(+)